MFQRLVNLGPALRLAFLHGGLLIAFASVSAQPPSDVEKPGRWQTIGSKHEVERLDDGTFQIHGSSQGNAGILSASRSLPDTANAVLVEATAVCEARGLVFAAFDAETGECIGYWNNPLAAANETRLTAVLNLSAQPQAVRVFVGSHGQGGKARVGEIEWRFLRSGMKHSSAVYGMRIDSSRSVRQTFRATGDRFGAVSFRIRHARGFGEKPDLVVRLYRWQKDMATTIKSGSLVEFIVPGHQIPGTRQGASEDLDLSATYLDGARELSVPLPAETRLGEKLVLELALYGQAKEGDGFVTFGWLDAYEGGELYENNTTRNRNWDLRLETFDAVD